MCNVFGSFEKKEQKYLYLKINKQTKPKQKQKSPTKKEQVQQPRLLQNISHAYIQVK